MTQYSLVNICHYLTGKYFIITHTSTAMCRNTEDQVVNLQPLENFRSHA